MVMMHSPIIILVEPQMGENIGASARAMLNFGLEHMRIINPRDGWPNQKAVANASGAGRVLDGAQVSETTIDALSDINFVMATTARTRDLVKKIYTPEEAVSLLGDKIISGQTVAVLFGPERAGLSNEDVVLADALISIPVNPSFSSLNLAQSVLLFSYEWMRASNKTSQIAMEKKDIPATKKDIDVYINMLINELDNKGFFFPEDKRISMQKNLRNMFHKQELSDVDVKTLHGILKILTK